MRSRKCEKRHLADSIRKSTGLARVICSQIALASVRGLAASLMDEWNSPSATLQSVASSIRLIGKSVIAVGPRGMIKLGEE